MAMQVKAGSIDSPTGTGNQAFTGVGFQPKVLLLFFDKSTADGNAVSWMRCMGFGTSSTDRAAHGTSYIDNVAGGTANMGRSVSGTHVLYAYEASSGAITAFLVADIVTLDADGFTLNFTTVQASAYKINYIALGGADLTNYNVSTRQAPAATGSQGYTGEGFQPDCIIAIGTGTTTALPVSTNNAGARNQLSFGISGSAFASAYDGNDSDLTKYTGKGQKADIMLMLNANASPPVVLYEATLTSLDSDGYTWNWTTTSNARFFFVLALKGGQYGLGVFNQNVTPTTGNQAVSGLAFQPVGVTFASFGAASTTSLSAAAQHGVGAANSSTSRFALTLAGAVSANTSVVDHNLDNANVIKSLTAGTPTVNTVADFVSLDATGFTINNTTVDATSREIIYLMFGNTAVAAAALGAYKSLLGVGL